VRGPGRSGRSRCARWRAPWTRPPAAAPPMCSTPRRSVARRVVDRRSAAGRARRPLRPARWLDAVRRREGVHDRARRDAVSDGSSALSPAQPSRPARSWSARHRGVASHRVHVICTRGASGLGVAPGAGMIRRSRSSQYGRRRRTTRNEAPRARAMPLPTMAVSRSSTSPRLVPGTTTHMTVRSWAFRSG
jgi:hypothetical protein